ncbi:MAG: hypothetical protein GY903_29355 [Fuerstiella sp.]|nr:hypothetical protein [Fuerstiella sp.]MCP4858605.1 hypothetical protein [Fuerstiella sp.]
MVTVPYGVNDIGWGLRADEEHRRQYLDAMQRTVAQPRPCHFVVERLPQPESTP